MYCISTLDFLRDAALGLVCCNAVVILNTYLLIMYINSYMSSGVVMIVKTPGHSVGRYLDSVYNAILTMAHINNQGSTISGVQISKPHHAAVVKFLHLHILQMEIL